MQPPEALLDKREFEGRARGERHANKQLCSLWKTELLSAYEGGRFNYRTLIRWRTVGGDHRWVLGLTLAERHLEDLRAGKRRRRP